MMSHYVCNNCPWLTSCLLSLWKPLCPWFVIIWAQLKLDTLNMAAGYANEHFLGGLMVRKSWQIPKYLYINCWWVIDPKMIFPISFRDKNHQKLAFEINQLKPHMFGVVQDNTDLCLSPVLLFVTTMISRFGGWYHVDINIVEAGKKFSTVKWRTKMEKTLSDFPSHNFTMEYQFTAKFIGVSSPLFFRQTHYIATSVISSWSIP